MRLFHAIIGDIRYQMKYGFYFLYAFMICVYLGILALVPSEFKNIAVSIILLTDPAALGFFFIGGIWLLEKSEGIHKFHSISPLHPLEYSVSKALSLSLISTATGTLIVLLGVPSQVNYPLLVVGMFLGSGFFTLLGLMIATYTKSVNHYMLISAIPGTVVIIPAVIAAFNVNNALLEILPASILWRLIEISISGKSTGALYIILLIIWLLIILLFVNRRITIALQMEGGEHKNDTNVETV